MVSEASVGEQSGQNLYSPWRVGERQVLRDGEWGPMGRVATEATLGHSSRSGVREAGTHPQHPSGWPSGQAVRTQGGGHA